MADQSSRGNLLISISGSVGSKTEPEIDINKFPREDWSATPYGECKEETPSNGPEPRVIVFTIRAFVDSDHAGDMIT